MIELLQRKEVDRKNSLEDNDRIARDSAESFLKDLTENKALTEAADAEKKVEQEKEKEKEIAMKEKLCKAAWTQKKAMRMKIRKRNQ